MLLYSNSIRRFIVSSLVQHCQTPSNLGFVLTQIILIQPHWQPEHCTWKTRKFVCGASVTWLVLNLYYLLCVCVCERVMTASNTCSTTIPAKSLKISFRSEMDCTICRISLSRSSTITEFCSTSISWSSVNPWSQRMTVSDYTVTILTTNAATHLSTVATFNFVSK